MSLGTPASRRYSLSPSVRTACNLQAQGYKYTEDLLRLERELPQSGAATLPEKSRSVCTPLNISEWSKWLASFPDSRLAEFLTRGFKFGFRIGCKYNQANRPSCSRKNMASVYNHTEVISYYIDAKSQAGRLVGPLDPKIN